MERTIHRRPLGNFFIKKNLQQRLILRIVAAVLFSTAICALTLFLIYYYKYKSTLFYWMNQSQDLGRQSIGDIIFPTLLISAAVNIVVAFAIGLYASRKYAVPIFKLEQWVNLLLDGKLTARLQFREKDELSVLSTSCNELSQSLGNTMSQLKEKAELLQTHYPDSEIVGQIRTLLADFDTGGEDINVHTQFIRPEMLKPKSDSSQ